MPLRNVEIEHRTVALPGIDLHVVVAGNGPLVVLLHGFPEFWYSWRYQIPVLVRAGYRVAVPDMRGYNLSAKPKGVANYSPDLLVGDVAHLIEALGERKAHVVGHDWGANVAWMFAMNRPDRLDRLVICNVPHPVVFARHLYTWKQGVKKSWYVFFFQLPWLPEWSMLARDCRSIRTILAKDPVNPERFSRNDVEEYVKAFRQPGAATAAINYYRAIFRVPKDRRKEMVRPIENPTMMIWGMRDRFLGPELVDTPAKLVPDLRIERIEDSSHWVQCDQPERVNSLLLDFLGTSA